MSGGYMNTLDRRSVVYLPRSVGTGDFVGEIVVLFVMKNNV
jgi:hypothetical protein